jgi:hypothetical protein
MYQFHADKIVLTGFFSSDKGSLLLFSWPNTPHRAINEELSDYFTARWRYCHS